MTRGGSVAPNKKIVLPKSLVKTFDTTCSLTQKVHLGIWYTLRAQWGSHIPTLRPKYLPYNYMDPLGYKEDHTVRGRSRARDHLVLEQRRHPNSNGHAKGRKPSVLATCYFRKTYNLIYANLQIRGSVVTSSE